MAVDQIVRSAIKSMVDGYRPGTLIGIIAARQQGVTIWIKSDGE